MCPTERNNNGVQIIMDYANPTWTPNLSTTNQNKLQSAQNSTLYIITGCTQTTPTDHTHRPLMQRIKNTKNKRPPEHVKGTVCAIANFNRNSSCNYMKNYPQTSSHIHNTL